MMRKVEARRGIPPEVNMSTRPILEQVTQFVDQNDKTVDRNESYVMKAKGLASHHWHSSTLGNNALQNASSIDYEPLVRVAD
jgi:hypothetical protein